MTRKDIWNSVMSRVQSAVFFKYLSACLLFHSFIQYSLKVLQTELPSFPSPSRFVPNPTVSRRPSAASATDKKQWPCDGGQFKYLVGKKIIIRGEVDSYIIFQYRAQEGRDATSYLRSTSSHRIFIPLSMVQANIDGSK